MADRDEEGIAFSFCHTQQSFRLLELPPPLVDMLTSDNPPALTIKSSDATLSDSSSPSHAVLCTPGKTYQLRQVHSSNSIFLTQPLHHSDHSSTETGISVVACLKSTLELHSAPASPDQYLRQLLPEYAGLQVNPDYGNEAPSVSAPDKGMSKLGVFSDIAASDEECERAWIDSCAFEDTSYRAKLPSAGAKLGLWRSIISIAVSEGLRVESVFSKDDLWRFVSTENWPRDFFNAVLIRLSTTFGSAHDRRCSFDRGICVPWVGSLILEAGYSDHDMPIEAFLDAWKDHLPEAWRNEVSLSRIENNYFCPGSTSIRFKQSNSDGEGPETVSSSAPKHGPNKRKWHEKFRGTAKR
ncbi:MAG: hypothetical protein M1833_001233 [Piccolia ochrophora]|nr:MAG: hypothetical protein M1833_001233 [Piccolia ochrophora]